MRQETGLDTMPDLQESATAELAGSLRVPITILGDTLRRAGRGRALPPSQGQALSQLSAQDSLTVSQLAQAQEVAVSSMTETIQRLEAKGLITKTGAQQDRRQVRVAITPEGHYRLRETVQARDELLLGRLERLDSDDLERLTAAAPVLWQLARLDSRIWPRIPSRPRRPRSRENQALGNH